MTAIRRGTARRLGIRPPLAHLALQFADAVGVQLDPWQKHMVSALYRRPDRPLAVSRPRTPWEDLRGAADILGFTWPAGAMAAALRESDPRMAMVDQGALAMRERAIETYHQRHPLRR